MLNWLIPNVQQRSYTKWYCLSDWEICHYCILYELPSKFGNAHVNKLQSPSNSPYRFYTNTIFAHVQQ